MDGSTAIGTGTLNASDIATFSTSALTTGTHSITAVYGGDSNFFGSTSSPVLQTVAYTPAQISTAYGFDKVALTGLGQTIAIVAAYDDPYLVNSTDPAFSASDLARFDKQFNIPDPPSNVYPNNQWFTK